MDAVVSNTANFGVFVSLKSQSNESDQAIEGFIHLSELSWDRLETAEKIYNAR